MKSPYFGNANIYKDTEITYGKLKTIKIYI